MKTTRNYTEGISSITVNITLADSIKLSNLLDAMDAYDAAEEALRKWEDAEEAGENVKYNDETGEWDKMVPKPEDPLEVMKKMGYDPMDCIANLRKFARKFCFVKLSESNIFDDEDEKAPKK